MFIDSENYSNYTSIMPRNPSQFLDQIIQVFGNDLLLFRHVSDNTSRWGKSTLDLENSVQTNRQNTHYQSSYTVIDPLIFLLLIQDS